MCESVFDVNLHFTAFENGTLNGKRNEYPVIERAINGLTEVNQRFYCIELLSAHVFLIILDRFKMKIFEKWCGRVARYVSR